MQVKYLSISKGSMGVWATCPARQIHSTETCPWDKERILGRDTQVHLGHTKPKGPGGGPEAQKWVGPMERSGMGGTQAALTSLHVVKGARASCEKSAQLLCLCCWV